MIAVLAVAAFLASRSPQEPEPTADLAGKTIPAEAGLERAAGPTSPAPPAHRVPVDELAVQLGLQQSLRGVRLPIETRAGSLSIGKEAGESGKQVLMLDATPVAGLRDDQIVLAHRAEYTDREVLVGFTQCAGATPPCGVRKPFWVVLRAGQPPVIRLAPELWTSSTAGVVTARDTGVRVDLGVWNGERRATTLTHAGDLETARQRAPIAALNRADCALVAESLEYCAASANCQSFASSARSIPRRAWARLTRIYHEKTGLDAAAYRELCVRSCEFGLTPSPQFIRQSTCSGAQRGQWATESPAAGLLGERG